LDHDDEIANQRRHSAAGAALAHAVAEDGFFPRWKRTDVAQWLTIIATAIAIYAGLSMWFPARFATRKKIGEQIQPVLDGIGVVTRYSAGDAK
jgi:hypothetical protein